MIKSTKLRVLAADDHWIARVAIEQLLKKSGLEYELLEAATSDEVIRIAQTNNPLDLIILDLNMPGRSAWATIKELRAQEIDAPIMIMSVSEQRTDVLKSLEEGAVGYVPKTADPEVILSTIRRVLNGEVALPQKLLVKEEKPTRKHAFTDDEKLARIFSALETFTPRQRDVFELLASGARNEEIADTLELSVNTIRVHMQAIASKLETRNRSEIALYASRWKERSIAA